jgi:hypothetical protein
MTIVEIERVFLCFCNQLQVLKDKYPNTDLAAQITNLIADVQVIKLKVMRMNGINEKENSQLTESVARHIHELQKRVAELKQACEIATFDA